MHRISLDDIHLINLIAKKGSFASAAALLNLPRPNVTRRVKQVEEFLGVMLFQRSTRRLTLTPEGQAFLQHSSIIDQQWQTALAQVQATQDNVGGKLKVWGLGIVSRVLSGKCISDFIHRYPGIELEMMSSWSNLHLRKFDADLILDTTPVDDKGFISEPIAWAKHDFYATPTYLARNGVPKHPEDMPDYDLVIHNVPRFSTWTWPDETGYQQLKVDSNLKFEEVEAVMNMTLCHHGISWLPSFICDYFVDRGELIRLFEGRFSTDVALYAIYPRTPFQSVKSRLFIDMVKQSGAFGSPADNAL